MSSQTSTASESSALPPRYSSLIGVLSPESSEILRSLSTTQGRAAGSDAYPPRYNGSSTFGQGRGSSDSRSGLRAFEYHLKSANVNKTQPWATLKVFSRASSSLGSNSSSTKLAKFNPKDLVQGCLELNLETPQSINSISLSLKGKISSQFEDGYYFLDHPLISWTRTNGDPRAPPDIISSRLPAVKKFDGKLSGSYIWPFSIPFPSEVTVTEDGRQQKHLTPQTFVERGSNLTIQYSLVLKVTHGMLRTDSKLQAGIVYIPDITPPAFSILRQVAYLQATKIPSPEADPLGWHTLPPAIVFGKLAGKNKAVKLQCSLSIANPLTYTRGSFIPVHLNIRSSDMQALKLLGNPREIIVRLTRRLQYYKNATQLNVLEGITEETASLEKVVWQATANIEEQESTYIKQLEGEIHLGQKLQPSCSSHWLKVSYAVELLPFNKSILKVPSSGSSEILLSHPITIVTQHSVGPAPVPSTTRLNSRSESSRPRSRTLTTIVRPDHQVVPYLVSYDLMVPSV